MAEQSQQVHPLIAILIYMAALTAGMVLICTDRATVPEASGYVAPFLLVYERMAIRR